MTFRLSDERVPETEPWRDREFLQWAYHERGLSPQTIAYELHVSKTRVTVHMERLGVLRPWCHEDTLRRLHVEKGLSADEIAARDRIDCSPVTVRKWLARYDLIDSDPDEITYGRLDELGNTESERAEV
jgi:orotate phosphoribosyltransferase-like protein